MRYACVVLLALVAGYASRAAEEWKPAIVTLKNGRVVKGMVRDEPDQPLSVKLNGVVATFERVDIRSIEPAKAGADGKLDENPFPDYSEADPKLGADTEFIKLAKRNLEKYDITRKAAWDLSSEIHGLRREVAVLQKAAGFLRDRIAEAEKTIKARETSEGMSRMAKERAEEEAEKAKIDLKAGLANAQAEIQELKRQYEQRIKSLEENLARELSRRDRKRK